MKDSKLVRKHGRLPLWNVVPMILSKTAAFDCSSNTEALEKYTILLNIILGYANNINIKTLFFYSHLPITILSDMQLYIKMKIIINNW